MQRRRLPVRLLGVAVILGVAAAIAWGLRPQPILVEVGTVSRGRLAVRVADDGVTRIRERYLVRAPLGGQMTRVDLHPGDEVLAGATVVTVIDPPDPALLDPRAEADALARVETAKASNRRARFRSTDSTASRVNLSSSITTSRASHRVRSVHSSGY